jgi:aryl-alcohol dehydrogenase-like predicted oxidoreductase
MKFLIDSLTDKAKNDAVARLEAVAGDLGCSLAQLAIAWCARNPRVSTVITGASRVSQVEENLRAAEFIDKLTPEVMKRVEGITSPLAE